VQANDETQPTDAATTPALRAIADLRRGASVWLRGDDICLRLAAAENCLETDALLSAEQSDLSLILTAARYAVLCPRGPHFDADCVRLDGPMSGIERQRLLDPSFSGPIPDRIAVRPATAIETAAIELIKLAHLMPAALVRHAGQIQENGRPESDPIVLDLEALDRAQQQALGGMTVVARAAVPLQEAEDATIVAFRPADGGKEHLAIVIGNPDPDQPVLIRLHSECFTGDLLASLRCDCGEQLHGAVREIERSGGGVILYLAQEGRGIGLVNKLRAYQLQDRGFDTIDANQMMGFDADERVYQPAAEMLKRLGYTTVRLLTNNPEKVQALRECGIAVAERVPHAFPANNHNERYLRTKAARAGHLL